MKTDCLKDNKFKQVINLSPQPLPMPPPLLLLGIAHLRLYEIINNYIMDEVFVTSGLIKIELRVISRAEGRG